MIIPTVHMIRAGLRGDVYELQTTGWGCGTAGEHEPDRVVKSGATSKGTVYLCVACASIWLDPDAVPPGRSPILGHLHAENIRQNQAAQELERQEAEIERLRALLQELIDIEGPQPGHVMWARKVQAELARSYEPKGSCVRCGHNWEAHCGEGVQHFCRTAGCKCSQWDDGRA